jgi:hypothetical protein
MENEPSFEINDKRRVHLEEETPPEPPAEATGAPDEPLQSTLEEQPAGPAPADEETAGDLGDLDVYSLLRSSISILYPSAWSWMGLAINPITGKMDKDLDQAKVAIDTIVFMVDKLEPHASEAERRELKNMVSMLQINYVQQLERNG